jgi:hypothetical protein
MNYSPLNISIIGVDYFQSKAKPRKKLHVFNKIRLRNLLGQFDGCTWSIKNRRINPDRQAVKGKERRGGIRAILFGAEELCKMSNKFLLRYALGAL